MSVSKRLGRVSQCAVSLIGVACLSVFANTERNGFIGVEGDAEFYKDGDDTIGIHNPIGAVEVVVEARDGWRFDDGTTKKNVDHEIGKTNDFVLVGRDGESSTKNYLVDDVEHVHESIVSEKHTDNAAIEPESAPDEIILVYAEPDYGAVVPSNCASWRIVQKATHTTTTKEIPCHMPECQWGNGTSSETVEIGPELSELVFSCDVPGAKDGLLTFGHYKIGYYASWTNRFCIEKECHAAAGTNSEISVFKVSVSNDQYIGLDMTDAGKDKYVVKNAKAKIEPTPSKGRYDVSYEWNTNPLCEIVEETKTRQEASYQNLSHKQASAAYQDQRLECQVTISAKDSQRYGSATCTNNFTVVKVDVEIEMPDAKNAEENEAIEETQGAYLYYIPDSNSWWTVEASNNLRKVKFRYWPEDLPKEQTVTIEADSELLYELKDRKYQPAKKNYTLKELGERDFVLHAHRRSEKYLGEEIRFTHDLSQAVDVAKYTIFGRPLLVPDYDRDGKIDEEDDARAQDGKTVFRFWINDDDDNAKEDRHLFRANGNGSINEKTTNVPGLGNNHKSGKVNGIIDLEDFTPIKIDLSQVFPEDTPEEFIGALTWKMKSSCVAVVWTDLYPSVAGDYRTYKKKNFGPKLNENSYQAKVTSLESETAIPKKALLHIISHDNIGVALMEGVRAGSDFEIMVEHKDVKRPISIGSLKLSISSVEEMYRWLDLRHNLANEMAKPVGLRYCQEPSNAPDSDCNGIPRKSRNCLYIHGFNVNQNQARGWAATIFKRFWQSGYNDLFTAVDWYGDIGQGGITGKDSDSMDYYSGVINAFRSSKYLAEGAKKLPGEKWIFAHSLGNVVASAAIQDWGLSYTKYYLVNAAVPVQAFKPDVRHELMVDKDWYAVNDEYRSCGWYKLFEADDFRSLLHWVNRFPKVAGNVINCYSDTDEVVGNDFKSKLGYSLPGSLWTVQERYKGRVATGIFDKFTPNTTATQEAGWGINPKYAFTGYITNYGTSVNELTKEDVTKEPLFSRFVHEGEKLTSLKKFKVTNDGYQYDLRAVLLADAIPATSFAAGANKMYPTDINLMKEEREKWPRKKKKWLHSDVKNVAYYFEKQFFDKVVK